MTVGRRVLSCCALRRLGSAACAPAAQFSGESKAPEPSAPVGSFVRPSAEVNRQIATCQKHRHHQPYCKALTVNHTRASVKSPNAAGGTPAPPSSFSKRALLQILYCICRLGRHASSECQRNNRRNQTVLPPPRDCRFAAAAATAAAAVVAAPRVRPSRASWRNLPPHPKLPRPWNHLCQRNPPHRQFNRRRKRPSPHPNLLRGRCRRDPALSRSFTRRACPGRTVPPSARRSTR